MDFLHKTKVKFLKVKRCKDNVDCEISFSGTFYPSIESLVEYDRMEYAKKLFWANNSSFYDDVEIPEEHVSIEEFQTEEGQHKEWNKYLSDIISEKESGDLLDYTPATEEDALKDCQVFIVANYNGKDVFFDIHKGDESIFEYEDVTNEYFKKYLEAMNTAEIEDFVNTHTQDEIEEKYAYSRYRDKSEMWEW